MDGNNVTVTVRLDSHVTSTAARARFLRDGQSEAAVDLRVLTEQRACANLTAQLNPSIADVSLPLSISATTSSDDYVGGEGRCGVRVDVG
ncbi:hypothetical protein FHG87_024704 [Trinorchestia longiramus]|nr:hypothetical protein FHG87_024704 [Trinorchestia longiramus]